MKIKLEVPFYAQREILTNYEKEGACGIVCVKMILNFAFNIDFDINSLLKEAYIVGGKINSEWSHEALVRVLRNHGVLAYRQEFIAHKINLEKKKGIKNDIQIKEFRKNGIEKIKGSIDFGFPVMVSVASGFGKNKSSHLILIVGYDENNFYINDPQRYSNDTHPLKTSIKKFDKYWNGLNIFVEFKK